MPPFSPGLALSLVDGTRWLIHAHDAEAARVVAALGAAMRLQPASPCPGGGPKGERELLVMAPRGGRHGVPPANLHRPESAICVLPPLLDDDMLPIGMPSPRTKNTPANGLAGASRILGRACHRGRCTWAAITARRHQARASEPVPSTN